MIDQSNADARQVDAAIAHIRAGRHQQARELLMDVVSRTPADYRPQREEGDSLVVELWSVTDFLEYVTWMREAGRERNILWAANAYPRAFYYLGYLAIETGDLLGAITLLDRGLQLEPASAQLANEKAQAFLRLGAHRLAGPLYDQVLASPGFLSSHDRAVALRGKAFTLVEEFDFDDAEAALRQSLDLEPDSTVAMGELEAVQRLRRTAGKRGTP